MEKYFGVSYPTIKNRLQQDRKSVGVRGDRHDSGPDEQPRDATAVLERLSQGEITAAQAIDRLKDK